MKIASRRVTSFCLRNTSSKLHSRVTWLDVFSFKNLQSRNVHHRQMKFTESRTAKLILVLLSFAALGLLSSCVKRQRASEGRLSNQSPPKTARQNQILPDNPAPKRININTAAAEELEKLPGIGPGFTQRIVEHREKYGRFRRSEHLIMVRGISDRRFRALRELITVE